MTESVASPSMNSVATAAVMKRRNFGRASMSASSSEQRGAGDQLKALVDPGGEDLAWRAGWRDRGRHEHVGVQHGAHAPSSALGSAPVAAHRMQLAVRKLHGVLGVERFACLARLLL
jgi:hypothetical protein